MKINVFATVIAASLATTAVADGVVNLYSSRHYDTDERLYSDFEEATGITINRIEGKADELIARMQAEGANSPADILLTVDTSRLARAKDAGVLQSIDSDVLEDRIPSNLQDADNQWFGFSQRARIVFYDKADVDNPLGDLHGSDQARVQRNGLPPVLQQRLCPDAALCDHRKPR